MSSWLQNQFRAAEGLLEAVDRTAKQVSKKELAEGGSAPHARPREGSPAPSAPPGARTAPPVRIQPLRPNGASKGALAKPQTSLEARTPPPRQELRASPVVASDEAPQEARHPPASKRQLPSTETRVPAESPSIPPAASQDAAVSSAKPPEASATATDPRVDRSRPQGGQESADRPIPFGKQPAAEMPFQTSSPRDRSQADVSASKQISDRPSEAATDTGRPNGSSREELPGPEAVQSTGSDAAPDIAAAAAADAPLKASGGSPVEEKTSIPFGSQPSAQADAVLEAIKAASAATGSQELEEDIDGPMDASVREARLAKMVENLKRRLEQLRAENAQLEEMLQQADASVTGRAGDIGRLEDALAAARAAESSARAEALEAADRFDAELKSRSAALETARSRLSEQQARLAAAEEENEKLLQEREMSEARMLSALREEVAAAEQRLEDERFAAASARQSFAAREQELEATLSESAASLSEQQRALEEKMRRLTAAESRAAALESSQAELQAALSEAQSQLGRQEGQGESAAAQEQVLEAKERSASLEAALGTSESQRRGLELEVQQLRLDLNGLRHHLANAVSPEELDRRTRELTDLLYQKQSQLEKVAAERSAQQMAWEREISGLRDDAERSKRRVRSDRAMTFVDGDLVVPMADMESYQRLANHKRVGGAVKAGARFLDATTLTAVRFLRQYPLGRLAVFAYLLLIHLFVYLLIHHLQQRALHEPDRGLRLDKGP